MPKMTFADHPLHPQLIVMPTGLLPFSLAMDVLHLLTRRKCFADAAWYSLVGGYAGAAAAAVAGGGDYFAIPADRPVKRVANIHAVLNLLGMGLYSVNLVLRRGRERRSSLLTTLLSAIGVAGISISAWYGGHMVYEHGLRVRGISPADGSREVTLPGSHRVSDWMHQIEQRYAPAEPVTMA